MTSALDYMGKGIKTSAYQKAGEVLAKVSGADSIRYVWGYDPNVKNTEHHSGLAADFMVFGDKALGDRIFAYLWNNRVRLGVQHIIWQQSIISTVIEPGVRRVMSDRGNDTNNHRDHVHVLFFDKSYSGATVKPPVQPAKVVKPSPTSTQLHMGSRGNAVKTLQRGLNRVFPAYSRLATDGIFGSATAHVVREFQRRTGGLTVDGVVGPRTRSALNKVGITF